MVQNVHREEKEDNKWINKYYLVLMEFAMTQKICVYAVELSANVKCKNVMHNYRLHHGPTPFIFFP